MTKKTLFNFPFWMLLHRSLTSKTRLIQRLNLMGSQVSMHLFRPKSSVKLYSFSVTRNYAYPITMTLFSQDKLLS